MQDTPGSYWNLLLGGPAKDISVSGNGKAWMIASDGSIWRYLNAKWIKVAGLNAVKIEVGPDGLATVIDGVGNIYKYDESLGWINIKGYATEITIGSDGSQFIIGAESSVWKRINDKWVKLQGVTASKIDADGNGTLWLLNQGYVYTYAGSTLTKQIGEGGDVEIGVSPSGVCWAIDAAQGIWRFNKTYWGRIQGTAIKLDVDANNKAWIVKSSGEKMYYR